jgi:hypothetical protein
MSAVDWAGLIVAVMTVAAGFVGAVRWLVMHYLAELKPNGGSSLKDQVNALQVKVDLIYDLITAKRK